jgi:nucleotide-binding universal stress UspA family protein
MTGMRDGQLQVLLATDGSEAARHAEIWAANLRTSGRRRILDIACVAGAGIVGTGWGASADRPAVRQAIRELQESDLRSAERVANSVGERLQADADITVRTWARQGVIAEELIGLVEDLRPDITIVGHRGRSRLAHLVLGSVATALVTHSPRATLVVRNDPSSLPAPGRALVVFDGTSGAERMIRWLAELGILDGAEVTLLALPDLPSGTPQILRDATPDVGEALAERVASEAEAQVMVLGASGALVEPRVDLGHPLEAIQHAIEADRPDVVVLPRHAAPRGREALADEIVRQGPTAVLVVPVS